MKKLHCIYWTLLIAAGGATTITHYLPAINAKLFTMEPHPFWVVPIGYGIIALAIALAYTGRVDWEAD